MLAVLGGGIVAGMGIASASDNAPTAETQYGLPNSSIQWVHMPSPGPHLFGVWCVVVNGSANDGSGAGVTCDWDQNGSGNPGSNEVAP